LTGATNTPQCYTATLTGNPAQSTFDSNRNTSGAATLSNGNLTAHLNSSNNITEFGTILHSSGKWFFRITWDSCSGTAACAVGLGTSSAASAQGEWLGVDAQSVGVYGGGDVWIGGLQIGSLGTTFASGNTVDVVADLTAKTIQIAVNGGALSSTVSIANLASLNVSPAISLGGAGDQATYTGQPTSTYPGATVWDGAVGPPVISAINFSPGVTFTIPQSANPIEALSVTCSGSCATPTFSLVTAANSNGQCSGTLNNNLFSISGANLNAATLPYNTASAVICLRAQMTGATDFFHQTTLTGSTSLVCNDPTGDLVNTPTNITVAGPLSVSASAIAGTPVTNGQVSVSMTNGVQFCGNLNFPGKPCTNCTEGTDNGNFTLNANHQLVVAPSGPSIPTVSCDAPQGSNQSCKFAGNNAVLQNMTINVSNSWYGIEITGSNVTIQNVAIHTSNTSYGIDCQNGTGVKISHVTIIQDDVPVQGPSNAGAYAVYGIYGGLCTGAQMDHIRTYGYAEGIGMPPGGSVQWLQVENMHGYCTGNSVSDCSVPGSSAGTGGNVLAASDGATMSDWSANDDLRTTAVGDRWSISTIHQGNPITLQRGRLTGEAEGAGSGGVIEPNNAPLGSPQITIQDVYEQNGGLGILTYCNGSDCPALGTGIHYSNVRYRRCFPQGTFNVPWYQGYRPGTPCTSEMFYCFANHPVDYNVFATFQPGDTATTIFNNGTCSPGPFNATNASNYTDRDFIQLRGTGMPEDGGAGHLTQGNHTVCLYAEQNGYLGHNGSSTQELITNDGQQCFTINVTP
jgi:hypothetical protein